MRVEDCLLISWTLEPCSLIWIKVNTGIFTLHDLSLFFFLSERERYIEVEKHWSPCCACQLIVSLGHNAGSASWTWLGEL
jgi:hypothetical protein